MPLRVGVLGGGQLGRMLGLAGRRLGVDFRFLDPAHDACASGVGPIVSAPFAISDALGPFVSGLDVVTYEFENVPVDLARSLASRVPVHPAPEALEMAQDRIREKEGFRALGIPVADFRTVDSDDDALAAGDSWGTPSCSRLGASGTTGRARR